MPTYTPTTQDETVLVGDPLPSLLIAHSTEINRIGAKVGADATTPTVHARIATIESSTTAHQNASSIHGIAATEIERVIVATGSPAAYRTIASEEWAYPLRFQGTPTPPTPPISVTTDRISWVDTN